MATYFTGWDFNKSLEKAIDRNDRVKANNENNKFRAKELGEKIAAREAMDAFREKELADKIQSREEARQATKDARLYDWTKTERKYERDDELLDIGKTKEERAAKKLNKANLATIPNFEEYDQNEAVTESKDFIFDEGEFRRASDDYITSIEKNLPTIISMTENDPENSQLNRHLNDLEEIYEVLDSGEYSGPLDSTIFDWFDGEASGAKKSKSRIARILSAAGRL